MSDAFPVFTALPSLGFLDRGHGELEFCHPECELAAVEACTPFPIVAFAGNVTHSRSFGYREFNLPAVVESLDQLKAFLGYYLRDAFTKDVPAWIVEGLAFSHLLPWERELAAYQARDCCDVRREWLKLALKEVAATLKAAAPSATVVFGCDGSALSIDCGRRIIVQAEGSPWKDTYRVSAKQLAHLPRRLSNEKVEVSVWENHLRIGNRMYPLAAAENSSPNSP